MDRDTQRQYHLHHHHHQQQHQPSYTGFFTGHPIIQEGYPNENVSGGWAGVDMYRGRLDMREAILREIEKERIRGEIIAEEIERRRILEIEVRNEMMMERHMAMRSSEGRFSSGMTWLSPPPRHNNLFEQRSLNPQPNQLEDRLIMSIDEKHSCDSRGLSVSSFQPCGDSLKIKDIPTGGLVVPFQPHGDSLEIKESVPPEDNRKEIILLGKPDVETLSGTKRKLTSPVAESSSKPRADSSKKKVKEWSCAICQVSTTSEHALNEHLQGKKHKVKEANFIAEKTGANFGLGVTPKKPEVNPLKLALTTANLKKSVTKEASSTTDSNHTKRGTKKKKEIKRDKYSFWCEMCQAGAFSEETMNSHKKGKKHSTRLAELYRNGKVESEAPARGKSRDAEESEMDTKKAVVEKMVAFEDKTKAETETKNGVVLEAVTDEKSETEVNKMMVVETVKYGMENVTAEEAETVMDGKQNVAEDARI